MPAVIVGVRTRLRYRDVNSGLCWSVNGYWWGDIDGTDLQTAADDWNSQYLAYCTDAVKLIDFAYSRLDVLGESIVIPGSSFTNGEGTAAGSPLPMAECILVTGKSNDTAFGIGRWQYKLHGIAQSFCNSAGEFVGGAGLPDFLAACKNYLFAYRKTAGARPYWTVIDPPAQAPEWEASTGFYVRRLGQGFFLPGQRRRY